MIKIFRLYSVLAISNDAGVDQNLLAKAFRQALPALKNLNDANEKACGALGSVANHPLEKAEVIADSLQKQFEPNTEGENDRFTARTQRKIKRFLDAPTCLGLEKTTPGKNWKTAVVVPILKPNSDDTRPQNYRPISLLSGLSKAYEFVLLNRLNQHCIARNIIIPEQHGFVTSAPQ
ncbi:RNA-directed DNA polymerase from mobile element jockey [Trichonephila clavipes]|nr:RNA-directed DNA polymerase from mobile element jockey [Trichonephila clavipes]